MTMCTVCSVNIRHTTVAQVIELESSTRLIPKIAIGHDAEPVQSTSLQNSIV